MAERIAFTIFLLNHASKQISRTMKVENTYSLLVLVLVRMCMSVVWIQPCKTLQRTKYDTCTFSLPQKGFAALMLAAREGRTDVVFALVRCERADVNL